jgi:hypothetical protein
MALSEKEGYRIFPGVKRPGLGVDHSLRLKELYICSLLWALVACSRLNFSLTVTCWFEFVSNVRGSFVEDSHE